MVKKLQIFCDACGNELNTEDYAISYIKIPIGYGYYINGKRTKIQGICKNCLIKIWKMFGIR